MFFGGWGFRENLGKLVAKINIQKNRSKKVRILGVDRTINSSYDMKY